MTTEHLSNLALEYSKKRIQHHNSGNGHCYTTCLIIGKSNHYLL